MRNSSVTAQFNSSFAVILRGLLERSPKTGKKTTYKTLAEYLEVKQQSVSSWANGTTIPDTKHIAPIADFFDVSCDYLLGMTKTKTTNVVLRWISEFVGLSDEAIAALHYIEEKHGEILSKVISNINFYYFVCSVKEIIMLEAGFEPSFDFDTSPFSPLAVANYQAEEATRQIIKDILKKEFDKTLPEPSLEMEIKMHKAMGSFAERIEQKLKEKNLLNESEDSCHGDD